MADAATPPSEAPAPVPSAPAQSAPAQPAQPAQPAPTAAVTDASLRLGLPLRWAPQRLQPLLRGRPFAGRARPVTHHGSVDVLLEVIDESDPGDVLVIDNAGRLDEACIGDLMVAEAALAGIAGIVLWGMHRDTAQLHDIGLPLHSLGAFPLGPRRVPPTGPVMRAVSLDSVLVTDEDVVVADDDGALFVSADRYDEVVEVARAIQATESRQARLIQEGTSLREQLDFAAYLAARRLDPSLTLRRHLLSRDAAIEV